MRSRLAILVSASLFLGCAGGDEARTPDLAVDGAAAAVHNVLNQEERDAGWELLFDGESLAGWHAYGETGLPSEGWGVDGGDLVVFAGGIGGDIVSDRTYGDFELTFDFKLSPDGNSGVFYRVVERDDAVLWQMAPEFQVLDDPAYIAQGVTEKHLTGDNYDLHVAVVRPTHPVGEWNQGRIVVDGAQVEHWLNGERTVAYELWSDDWEARVAESKFAPHPLYGRALEGAIALQDHDHEIRYRNLRIRRIR